jgi:gas vesicle protein
VIDAYFSTGNKKNSADRDLEQSGMIILSTDGNYYSYFKRSAMTTKTKVILGLVGAAAAGVVVGLLLAPEKGSDMRKKVKDTAGDWAGHLSDLFTTAKGEISNLKNKGSRVATEAGNTYNNVKESYS